MQKRSQQTFERREAFRCKAEASTEAECTPVHEHRSTASNAADECFSSLKPKIRSLFAVSFQLIMVK